MKTAADPQGERVLGTMQNCANGHTPWGTYLTCEENWSDIFVKKPILIRWKTLRHQRQRDESYRWNEVDDRFSVDKTLTNPTVSAGCGEIDLRSHPPAAQAHSAGPASSMKAPPSRSPPITAWYHMGTTRSLSTFINSSRTKKYDPANREANMQLLTSGTLYVARFNEEGSGDWLPLIFRAEWPG